MPETAAGLFMVAIPSSLVVLILVVSIPALTAVCPKDGISAYRRPPVVCWRATLTVPIHPCGICTVSVSTMPQSKTGTLLHILNNSDRSIVATMLVNSLVTCFVRFLQFFRTIWHSFEIHRTCRARKQPFTCVPPPPLKKILFSSSP